MKRQPSPTQNELKRIKSEEHNLENNEDSDSDGSSSKTPSVPDSPKPIVEDYFYAGELLNFYPHYLSYSLTPVQHPHGFRVLVYKSKDGTPLVIKNICPHQGSPLHNGTIVDIEDFGVIFSKGVKCPKHGWTIDLNSGMCGSSMAVVDTFGTKIVDNLLYISIEPTNLKVDGPRRDFGGVEVNI